MLWFSMMLMPIGPSAMILVALTDVIDASENMKMTIAKFLTVSDVEKKVDPSSWLLTKMKISYAITPLICFSVVGALKATEAAIDR